MPRGESADAGNGWSGDAAGDGASPSGRPHGEPSSPLGAKDSASEPPTIRLFADLAPLGGWGVERAESGATYGDRRAMQAPARGWPHRPRRRRPPRVHYDGGLLR